MMESLLIYQIETKKYTKKKILVVDIIFIKAKNKRVDYVYLMYVFWSM